MQSKLKKPVKTVLIVSTLELAYAYLNTSVSGAVQGQHPDHSLKASSSADRCIDHSNVA